LIDHRIAKWEVVDAPSVSHDLKYDFNSNRGKMIRIFDIDRDASFILLDEALRRLHK
jgi:hypothetical protein